MVLRLLTTALGVLAMGAGLAGPAARAGEPVTAFAPGEQSTYRVHYLGMEAGTALISVGEMTEGGREVWPIVALARTSSVFSLFPVHDKLVSVVDPSSSLTLSQALYADENHKRHEQHVTLDQARHKALVVKQKVGEPATHAQVDITPGTQDLTVATFLLRNNVREVGQVISFPVFTGQRTFNLRATVLGRQRLKTPLGEREVFKVRVQTALSGQFQSRRDMFAYLTTDATHVPVRIEAEFVLGSIVAELTDYKQGRTLAAADIRHHDG